MTDINGSEPGAIAKITYGGLHYTYVGMQLVSDRGAAIHSLIEIYRDIDYPFKNVSVTTNKTVSITL